MRIGEREGLSVRGGECEGLSVRMESVRVECEGWRVRGGVRDGERGWRV